MGPNFRVALTLDVELPERPISAGVTESLLDVLATHEVRATTFVQGRWAQAFPATARSITGRGHVVGCHSHYHVKMPMLTRRGRATDVRTATRVIADLMGVDPRPWFRCPFGAMDRGTAILDQLATLGYRLVGWHVDSRDWASSSADSVVRRVVDGAVAHGDGAVILMHGWPAANLNALPRILAALTERGAQFVTVDQLEHLPVRSPGDQGET